MKESILLIVFSIVTCNLIGQTYYYDGQGHIIGGSHIRSMPPKTEMLIDSVSNIKYCLDSTHIYISAITVQGDTLWTIDPWKEHKLSQYRMKRPFIVYFKFENLDKGYASAFQLNVGERVIWIVYYNTQFGFITLANGKFYFGGQD